MDKRERREAGGGSAARLPQRSGVLVLGLAVLLLSMAPGPRLRAQEAFSPGERTLIARNASLRAAAAHNPALARRALAALSAPQLRMGGAQTPEIGTRDIPLGPERGAPNADSAGTEYGFDAAQDPDLGALQRASPEAAHDLFLLLKRASASPTRKPGE